MSKCCKARLKSTNYGIVRWEIVDNAVVGDTVELDGELWVVDRLAARNKDAFPAKMIKGNFL